MKYIFAFTFGVILLLSSTDGLAQNSRESETSAASKASTSFSKKNSSVKKILNAKHDQSLVEYEKLMKANKKKYAKMQKGMEKPKYSDPTYFGHKKKPKKRDADKRKFCKECSMIH